MKLEKKYTALIAVIIILIFLFAFFYFSKFSFLNFKPFTTNTGGEEEPSNVETANIGNPPKPFSFASASCTVSGSVDIVRFKIQAGEHSIGAGEMSSALDNAGVFFRNSEGKDISQISLNANTVSDEFSYTANDHRTLRRIIISAAAGAFDYNVTCS
jgi:hypothetical protein